MNNQTNETKIQNVGQDTERVLIVYNNMSCWYYTSHLNQPFSLQQISKELENFYKTFFNFEYETWQGVMCDENVIDFFDNCDFIKNDFHQTVIGNMEDNNINVHDAIKKTYSDEQKLVHKDETLRGRE